MKEESTPERKGRGGPRIYPEGYDRRKAWDERNADRVRKAKAQWAKKRRQDSQMRSISSPTMSANTV